MQSKNQLLAVARKDYNPALVKIGENALRQIRIYASQPAMVVSPQLLNHPAGQSHFSAIAFILVLNSLNYMFWDKEAGQPELRRYQCDGMGGTESLVTRLLKAWHDVPSPVYLRSAEITQEWVVQTFGDIPMPVTRAEHLKEVLAGNKLEGVCCTLMAAGSADQPLLSTALASLIAEAFPKAYGDRYLKRAQLAISEIAGYLAAKGIQAKVRLTAFSDYQVPRVLRALGLLEYAEPLARQVDAQEFLEAESAEERALRAATLLCCEKLAELNNVDASSVGNYLWAQRADAGEKPFHLTRTTCY